MIQKEDYIYLRQHPALALFSISDFEKIASEIKKRRVAKGQVLFFEGDRRDRLFISKEGYLKLEQYDPTASFSYIQYVDQEELFPLAGLFDEETYRYTATAITDLEYYVIPLDLFEPYSKGMNQQLLYLYRSISKNLEFHELRLRNTSIAGAKERVQQALSILCYQFCQENERLPFPISSIDLSKFAATTRESVYQTMKDLKAREYLEYQGKQLVFLRPDLFLESYKKSQ